jgi:hypothetical protein
MNYQREHTIQPAVVTTNATNVIPFRFGMVSAEDEKLNRQDLVDNAVFDLLVATTPIVDWDISIISSVRDSIAEVLQKNNLISETEFYPSLDEETEEGISDSSSFKSDLDSLPLFIGRTFREAGQVDWQTRLTLFLLAFAFFVVMGVIQ